MTITAPEATRAPQLEYKVNPTAAGPQTLEVAPEGIVRAIVSVTGVVDEVADLIEPGAYTATLTKRRPKVIRNHVWAEKAGRVLDIEEYLPGDPRLPQQTKDGKPWPRAAGALVATMQYNLATDTGRKAYEEVRFYSESKEAEFSVGYQVPPGAATRDRSGVRRIKEMDLYEISDVLFGAAPLSMTLDVKSAAGGCCGSCAGGGSCQDEAPSATTTSDALDLAALHASAENEIDWAEVDAATEWIAGIDIGDGDTAQASEPSPPGAEQIAPADVAEGLALVGEVEAKRRFSTEHREHAAEAGAALPGGSFPIENAADLRNAIQALGRAKDINRAKRHIIARARALGLTAKLPKDWGTEAKDAVAEFAERNAERLAAFEAKEGGGDRNRGNAERLRRYWQREAGIPWGSPGDWKMCVTKVSEHMTPERAKGYCALRHHEVTGEWPGAGAHGGGKGKHGKGLEATLMAGEYVMTAADAREQMQTKLLTWEPLAEVGPYAAHRAVARTQAKAAGGGGPKLAGSLEELRESVRGAVTATLGGQPDPDGQHDWDAVSLLGTWPEKVVARRERYGVKGLEQSETFEVPYTIEPGGTVTLGDPVPVTLDVSVDPTFDTTVFNTMFGAAAGALADDAYAIKALLAGALEVKEGRVLSRVNLSRLRDAVTALLAVLAAAGVPIDSPSSQQIRDERGATDAGVGPEPVVTPDTTSANAREIKGMSRFAMSRLWPEHLAEGMSLLAASAEATSRLARTDLDAKGFDPDQPRDSRGRWIDIGAVVRMFGGGQGTVISDAGGGRFKIKRDSDGKTVIRNKGHLTVVSGGGRSGGAGQGDVVGSVGSMSSQGADARGKRLQPNTNDINALYDRTAAVTKPLRAIDPKAADRVEEDRRVVEKAWINRVNAPDGYNLEDAVGGLRDSIEDARSRDTSGKLDDAIDSLDDWLRTHVPSSWDNDAPVAKPIKPEHAEIEADLRARLFDDRPELDDEPQIPAATRIPSGVVSEAEYQEGLALGYSVSHHGNAEGKIDVYYKGTLDTSFDSPEQARRYVADAATGRIPPGGRYGATGGQESDAELRARVRRDMAAERGEALMAGGDGQSPGGQGLTELASLTEQIAGAIAGYDLDVPDGVRSAGSALHRALISGDRLAVGLAIADMASALDRVEIAAPPEATGIRSMVSTVRAQMPRLANGYAPAKPVTPEHAAIEADLRAEVLPSRPRYSYPTNLRTAPEALRQVRGMNSTLYTFAREQQDGFNAAWDEFYDTLIAQDAAAIGKAAAKVSRAVDAVDDVLPAEQTGARYELGQLRTLIPHLVDLYGRK